MIIIGILLLVVVCVLFSWIIAESMDAWATGAILIPTLVSVIYLLVK